MLYYVAPGPEPGGAGGAPAEGGPLGGLGLEENKQQRKHKQTKHSLT